MAMADAARPAGSMDAARALMRAGVSCRGGSADCDRRAFADLALAGGGFLAGGEPPYCSAGGTAKVSRPAVQSSQSCDSNLIQ